ncbi:DnaJ domain-containing protein [Caenimonas koreensis]|uniref:J domain-containing protein n=1 Tax=Caenimonas koreensis TaxID=367474 RepID=UPI0037842131
MDNSPAGRRSAVEAALLDYQSSPGKFALLNREPAVLFSSMKDVLQIAAGRAADEADSVTPSDELRRAASFFMRGAMLNQTADHYALLGVDRKATTDVVKDHYRLMMRLMHPDFAPRDGGAEWAPDTASRVNRAYETLSSTELRQQYDATLAPQPVSAALTSQAIRAAAETPAPVDPRSRLKSIAVVMGGLAVILLGVLLFGGSDRESLVQRQNEPAEQVEPVVEVKARAPEPAPTPVAELAPAPAAGAKAEGAIAPAAPRVAYSVLPSLPMIVGQLDQARPFVGMIMPAAKAPAATNPSPTLKISTAVSSMQATRPTPAVPVSTAIAAPAIQPPPSPLAPTQLAVAPPEVAPALARPNPGVTIAQVHPLLAELVQQVESGTGDRLLSVLDRDARRSPAALALVRQYNSLVDGGTVKVSHVQFRTEPQEGRLLVTGYLIMEVASPNNSPAGKELVLQAEFVSRNGAVIMTGLSRPGAMRAQ